jgi:hypothetical protein
MPVGGLTRSFKYNIKMDLRFKGCEDVTWSALVNTVINRRVPTTVNLVTNLVTTNLLKKTLHYESNEAHDTNLLSVVRSYLCV